jgi:glycosyltransferase involved in cell wall biosynthesis|tara:strand:- start:2266 stop:2862 length:597 start_codon:yes stop_codon:yes gene_type:complete
VIDDGSVDRTSEVVVNYQNQFFREPITLKRNNRTLGLARNYIDVAFLGKGEYYILVSGDNSESKENLRGIISKSGKADIIISYLKNDNRIILRKYLSKVFVWIINILSGHHLKYYNGPTLHRRSNVLRWHPNTYGFAFQAELITNLLNEGFSYIEVPITAFDRESGSSNAFNLLNILSVLHSLLEILFRRMRRTIFKV